MVARPETCVVEVAVGSLTRAARLGAVVLEASGVLGERVEECGLEPELTEEEREMMPDSKRFRPTMEEVREVQILSDTCGFETVV